MTPTTEWKLDVKKQLKTLKLDFEANMLDGDNVDDCGGAMLSAKEVWELTKGYFIVAAKARQEAYHQGEAAGRKEIKDEIGYDRQCLIYINHHEFVNGQCHFCGYKITKEQEQKLIKSQENL